MKEQDIKNILDENKRLIEENKQLKKHLKQLIFEMEKNQKNNALNESEDIEFNLKYPNKLFSLESDDKGKNDENIDDMSIISFLARSDKRVQILKSLSQGNKIPSVIGKEIGDSSHHVSKYLTSLKEKDLVECLNEDDKRFRFYSITSKGEHYLKLIEKEKY